MFLAIGTLRALQGDLGGPHFSGNMSWAPYAIVVVGALAIAALSWFVGTRKRKKP
jgi:LPXTG-motif cell wall-anchored protein